MQTLNGIWTLAPDPDNVGRAERWFNQSPPTAVAAPVPGVIQQTLPGYHGVAWYWHRFRMDADLQAGAGRVLVRFGAVDYLAEVWLNGWYAGCYEGGEMPFEFDASAALRAGAENLLAVRVLNPTNTPIDGYLLAETPHKNRVMSLVCGSTWNTGGIIYPVTLRAVPVVHIRDVFARPDPHTGRVAVTLTAFNAGPLAARGTLMLTLAEAVDGAGLLRTGQRLPSSRPVNRCTRSSCAYTSLTSGTWTARFSTG